MAETEEMLESLLLPFSSATDSAPAQGGDDQIRYIEFIVCYILIIFYFYIFKVISNIVHEAAP